NCTPQEITGACAVKGRHFAPLKPKAFFVDCQTASERWTHDSDLPDLPAVIRLYAWAFVLFGCMSGRSQVAHLQDLQTAISVPAWRTLVLVGCVPGQDKDTYLHNLRAAISVPAWWALVLLGRM